MVDIFTGIVEEVGTLERIVSGSDKYRLRIKCEKVLEATIIGDSIASNGLCLTVVNLGDNFFEADIMSESIKRSTFGTLKEGSKVNLERALTLNKPLGGHIVTGHIDGVGKIISKIPDGNAIWINISAGENILKYIVEKGSVSLDGISLTIAYVDKESFKVSVIPHTEKETNLMDKDVGDLINIECDIIGKYVEKFLDRKEMKKEDGIDEEFLGKYGFL